MTLLELRTLARQRLDDQTAPYLWSDAELNSYINQSVDEAAIRSRSLLDSTTSACCSIAVVAGKSVYQVHSSVFQIKRVFDVVSRVALPETSFELLDDTVADWQGMTGQPVSYVYDMNHYGDDECKGRSITLYPIPTASTTLKLTVYRTQLETLSDSDSPELPTFQHADLIWWACYLAYIKQDADANNSAKSTDFERKFAESFGQKQDARILEWRRKRATIRTASQFF